LKWDKEIRLKFTTESLWARRDYELPACVILMPLDACKIKDMQHLEEGQVAKNNLRMRFLHSSSIRSKWLIH